jgi:hypothetical protein
MGANFMDILQQDVFELGENSNWPGGKPGPDTHFSPLWAGILQK